MILRVRNFRRDYPATAIIKSLGITYRQSIPQTLYDAWDFIDCKNVPKELPENITVLEK